MKKFKPLVLIMFFVFLLGVSTRAKAQVCPNNPIPDLSCDVGVVSCENVRVWRPSGCDPDFDEVCEERCEWQCTCTGTNPPPPPPPSPVCGDGICNEDATCTQDCGSNDPPPTPPPTGDSCSGDCFTGIANCGAVGRPNGSGSCSNGGLCCNPPGGGVELDHPWCDEEPCDGLFCGQGSCNSNWHYTSVNATTPVWNHSNQSTIVIPATTNRATIIWTDPRGVVDCWKESESYFELNLRAISGWGGAELATVVNGSVGRPLIEGTGEVNRANQQMSYSFVPTYRYYRASVRGVNRICSNRSPKPGSWTTIEFQVYSTQTGKIFIDVNDDAVVDANGKCVSPSLNEADTNTHLLAQRDLPAWTGYNFDSWGFRTISGNLNDGTRPAAGLGAPFIKDTGTYGGSPASFVDDNWSTFWSSSERGEDVRSSEVGFNFTTPQPIQYIRQHAYHNPSIGVENPPHVYAYAVDRYGQRLTMYNSGVWRGWFLPAGTDISQIGFEVGVTGWDEDDRQRWGVAEIEAFMNPDPTPQLQTVYNGTETIRTAGWSDRSAYTILTAMGAGSALQLNLNSDEFTCSCPEGCQYNVSNSNQNMHFFINVRANPWFQIHDGAIAAYGNNSLAISNPIPEQCTSATNCTPTLIRTPSSTAPVVMTGGGTIDTSDAPGQQTTGIDDENRNWLARLSDTPARQDFAYFRRIYKFPSANVQDDFELNFNNATKPSSDPRNEGVEAYYHGGDLTITSDWTVSSGESYVILVDGDVNVNAQITVANGGFLAFVASGDVVFAPTLGSSVVTSTTPVVQGVFIADGRIRLPESNLKFVGAGTFVGWNGFDLLRDFGTTDNWSAPTELFIYRPDLLRNAPEQMKTPRYEWNEVNP